jgi:GMP synthase-like glutamine amidotransferase
MKSGVDKANVAVQEESVLGVGRVRRVHVLQHMRHEGLGNMATWLKAAGALVSFTYFFESDDLPDLEGIDLVIALGGPMSVNDEVQLPWLVAEKAFIRDAIHQGKAVLGICLGAQLIASALGADVYPNGEKEIGWFPVAAVNQGDDVFHFPPEALVFHWHGETFTLPDGATLLARSTACINQAFQIGKNVIGLQFHLEVVPAQVSAFIEMDCALSAERQELIQARPFIQSPQEILSVPATCYSRIDDLMGQVLAYLCKPVTLHDRDN